MNQVICQYAHQCRWVDLCGHGEPHLPMPITDYCESIMCYPVVLPCLERPDDWATCVDVPTLPGMSEGVLE